MVMADEDEMMRSIDEVDAKRTMARKEAAKQVRDLGVEYDRLVEQMNEVVAQLRTAVAAARGVFELEELAAHTKRTVPELHEWVESDGKSARRPRSSNRAAKSSRQDRRSTAQPSRQPASAPPS